MNSDPNVDEDRYAEKAKLVYSDERVASLAKEFGVPERLVGPFAENLRLSGAVYLAWKDDAREFVEGKVLKTQFLAIAREIESAIGRLDSLDEESNEVFWKPSRVGHTIRAILPGQVSPFGHTVRQVELRDGVIGKIYLRENDLREALRILVNYGRRAAQLVYGRPRGRQVNEALALWVGNMRQIWTGLLGNRFTFSAEDGVGTSRASKLCRAAMRPLDPSVTESDLNNAVRSERTNWRKESGRNIGKKSP